MPPKKRISCAMNTHIPSRDESFWVARLSK